MIFGKSKYDKLISKVNEKFLVFGVRLDRILEEVKSMKEETKELISLKDIKINNLTNEVKIKKSQLFKAEEQMEKLNNTINELKSEKRELASRIGGLSTKNKRDSEEIEKLKQQLEETTKNKYIKVELPAEKGKNTQKMKIKNHIKSSQTKAILRSKNEESSEVKDV